MSERNNNDYSDTLFKRGGGGVGGHVFRSGGPWLQIRHVNILIYLYIYYLKREGWFLRQHHTISIHWIMVNLLIYH